jgi:hypothetical protein
LSHLFNLHGSPVVRLQIVNGLATEVLAGSLFAVTASTETSQSALVWYSTTAHSINTDQPRTALEATPIPGTVSSYEVTILEETGVALPG